MKRNPTKNLLRKMLAALMLLVLAATLQGCEKPTDFDALQTGLRSRVEAIPGAQIQDLYWDTNGPGHLIRVELQLPSDDAQAASAAAETTFDAILDTANAESYERNAEIKVRVYGPTGDLLVSSEDDGYPSTLSRLKESR